MIITGNYTFDTNSHQFNVTFLYLLGFFVFRLTLYAFR